MRYYLICSQCAWSFTIADLIEMAECPSCGGFVSTEEGTQRYSEKQLKMQKSPEGEIATPLIQTDQIEQTLTRRQKAELQREENRLEKEHAARVAEDKQAAEKWLEEKDQYLSIALILDGKELICDESKKQRSNKQAIVIVTSIVGIIVIWLCYLASSCSRETPHENESQLVIREATGETPPRGTNQLAVPRKSGEVERRLD